MIYNNRLKQFSFLVGLIVVISLNLSCKKSKESNDTAKDSITILYIGDERIFHQDYWGMEATYWIFLPLVKYEGDERGEIQPVLAKSWTHSDDYRTWTVQLRKDIYWHDGVQMTAHDIKFTIEMREKVFGFKGDIICELIDDFTFQFTTIKPITNLDTWEVYYPKHLLEELDPENYYDWDFWKNPVGNGPYKFVRNIPKTMVEVEANPNYFGSQPKIKRAILKFSQTASLQELLSENVDAITFAPRDFLFKIKDDKRFKSYYWWGSWIESMIWNHNDPLFGDAKVRKALTMAINRMELSEVLNYPKGIPITDVLYSRNQRIESDLPPPIKFNPTKALQLLKECGWQDTNQDNVLDKNGEDFRFTVIVEKKNTVMATYIQDNYRRLGIVMNIETMERNIIGQRIKKNEFQAMISRFSNMTRDVVRLKTYFSKNSIIGFYNKELDSLLNVMEQTGNPKEIDNLYKQMAPIFEKEIPITFLLPQVQTHIVNSKIKGLNNLYKAEPVSSLESLWIE